MQNDNRRAQHDCRGVVLALFLVIVVVLVALAAMVIGFGFFSATQARLDNVANMTALAAVQTFAETGGTRIERAQAAVLRANEILRENGQLPGMQALFGDVNGSVVSDTLILTTVDPEGTNGAGGTIEFGVYYPEFVAGQMGSGPCAASASPLTVPCFDPNPGVNDVSRINAARIQLRTQQGAVQNWINLPFAAIFGSGQRGLQTSAIAMNTPRCFVYAMDMSGSVAYETHTEVNFEDPNARQVYFFTSANPPPPGSPWNWLASPFDTASVMAFPQSVVDFDCGSPNITSPLQVLWCNMPEHRNLLEASYDDGITGPAFPPISIPPCGDAPQQPCPNQPPVSNRWGNPRYHFRSDYRPFDGIKGLTGAYWVDSYMSGASNIGFPIAAYGGPQPWTRLFLAFNVGLRAVQQVGTPADTGMMYVFAGQMIDSEPEKEDIDGDGVDDWRLTNNFDFLVQLTNVMNRGMYDFGTIGTPGTQTQVHEARPANAIKRGWFPLNTTLAQYSSTNTTRALIESIDALSSCPPNAQKSIILATDGVGNCRSTLQRNTSNGRLGIALDSEYCTALNGSVYQNYLNSELALLNPANPQLSIREELIRNRIALTVLLDSRQVGPAFTNIQNNGVYLKPEEIFRSGVTICNPLVPAEQGCIPDAPVIPNEDKFQDWLVSDTGCGAGDPPPACTDTLEFRQQYAMEFMSTPGVQFRKPFAVFTQVAADTGGVTCVIQPRCDFDTPNPPYPRPDGCEGNPYLNGELRQDCYSDPGQVQNCSVIDQSESQQALRCVLGALGLSTYNVVGLAGN